MKKNTKWLMTALGAFCIGGVLGWLAGASKNPFSSPAGPSAQVRANLPEYKFISPLLFSDNAKTDDASFQSLAGRIQSYIDDARQKGQAEDVSVYFRDLSSSRWTGVNENELYTPSSMLKVIAMMAALKIAETDPAFLSRTLAYQKTAEGSKDYFPANDSISSGRYSVQDLIGYMIKYSDNDAFNALVADPQINAGFVQAYSLFRLPDGGLKGDTSDFMSPKSFASIFRTLYNSSFFEWNLSDQVLSLLSQTTFTDGLVAGVSPGTPVSHKFGENTDQLHDCGIVYHPDHPYLLCVMTRGADGSKLASVIGGISGIVWNFVAQGNIK